MRDHELRFLSTEKLFRRISNQNLKGTSVKPTSLRLQISVCRSQVVKENELRPYSVERYDGWAAITVSDARVSNEGHINISCIDDPSNNIPPHALIALWTNTEPPTDIDLDVERARVKLARHMKVIVAPSK